MRVRVDLVKSVRTNAGSFRYVTGEWDPANGVVWIEAGQLTHAGDVGKPRQGVRAGIHLESRVYLEELPPVEAAPPALPPPSGPKPDPTARVTARAEAENARRGRREAA